METLIGKRVSIFATRSFGSARLLHGLTGIVVARHPIAPGWVKVRLDPNPVTQYQEWSVPQDRLTVRRQQ